MKKVKKFAAGGLSSLANDGLSNVVTSGERTAMATNNPVGNVGAQAEAINSFQSTTPAENGFRPYNEVVQDTANYTEDNAAVGMKRGGKVTTKMSSGSKRSSKCPTW